MERLYLIDAMGLVFRAYHALNRTGLKNAAGEPTGAVFGFANMITSLIEREKPKYIAAVFDSKGPTFRHEKYADYKANRQAFPEDLEPQLIRIKEFIDALGMRRIEMPGYEADDIVGTLARKTAADGAEAYCVTSDKDYFQLVDENVKILRPSKNSGEYDLYDAESVKEKIGVFPSQVVDVLALTGDASDNVPGVKGIGEKTAVPLVLQFGSVEKIYERIAEIPNNAARKKLEDNREMAFLSKELVTIHCEVPSDLAMADCCWNPNDFAQLDAFLAQMNFQVLRNKWSKKGREISIEKSAANEENILETRPSYATDDNGKLIAADSAAARRLLTVQDIPHEYVLVNSRAVFGDMMRELAAATVLSVDLETTSLDAMNCGIVGVALCAREGRAFFIATEPYTDILEDKTDYEQNSLFAEPKVHYSADRLQWGDIAQELKQLLERPTLPKIGQNLKFDALILLRHNIRVTPVIFDTMLADYVLNPDMPHNMDALAERWINYKTIPITALIGEKKQGSMLDVPLDKITEYAAEDADVTLKLYNVLNKEIDAENVTEIARRIEFPLVEILAEMELNGVAIDVSALEAISVKIQGETHRLRIGIYREAGVEFNIDSPKQVGDVLFEKMMLPTQKKTKSGYSTDISALSKLAPDYPIAGMILEYRQLQKLQSTYVETLPRMVNLRTGRIHTTFNQTAAGTGRLSSSSPNLQNIPIRTEIGRSIRRAFVARLPNAVLMSADYSQIELRIMAAMAGDAALIDAFRLGKDIHAATAATLFGVELAEVNPQQRRIAKTVNFGIMYGQGVFGLAQQLGISRDEAKRIIEQYFAKYRGIRRYMDETLETARKKGYTQTLLGRRKYFPMITSHNQTLRQAAERAAINMPIQGAAADMMKIAMINVRAAMKKARMRSLMILQIHDELVFETYGDELDDMCALVKEQMESAYPLGEVPLIVEIGIGANWDEAH